jgi:hypothetical protein
MSTFNVNGESVSVSNVDLDGFFEVIIYDKDYEKLVVAKVKKFDIDLIPGKID